MLQLIADLRGPTADAVVPIRWCLSRDILERLRSSGAVNPHILLSVQDEKGRETERRLVPLEQAMDYVGFRRSGTNHVNAIILWSENSKRLRDFVLDMRDSERYEHRIYAPESWQDDMTKRIGAFEPNRLADELCSRGRILSGVTASLDVVVGQEFFAHEPRKWEKRWVNLWFKYDPRDQCEFRRRRILAYTVQPPIMLMATAAIVAYRTVFAAFTILLGIRGLNPGEILHPWSGDFHDLWCGDTNILHEFAAGYFCNQNDFFGSDKTGKRRMFFFGLFRPMWWTLSALVVWIASLLRVDAMFQLLIAAKVIGLIGLMALIVTAGYLGHEVIDSILVPDAEAHRRAKLAEQLRAQWESDDRYADIVCGAKPLVADVKTLARPTFFLRFQAIKAGVCKPYISR